MIHWFSKTHSYGRTVVRLTIDKEWIEPLIPLFEKVQTKGEWYLFPNYLMLRAIFYVNLSLLRRYYPHLVILYNDEYFEEVLPSPQVKYQRVPLSYELYHDPRIVDDGTPSYFVDGETYDPFWIESVIMGIYTTSSMITLTPVFLLSSDKVDVSSLKDSLNGVRDVDGLLDALLENFSVAVYFDGDPAFAVVTKDLSIVSFLEQAPKGKWDGEDLKEE